MSAAKPQGFTLIELLLAITLLIGLLFWGIYGFSEMITRHRAAILIEKIEQIIQFSRNASLSIMSDAALNPIDKTGDWSRGIILFQDNPRHVYTGQEEVLSNWNLQNYGFVVQWQGFKSPHYLVFSRDISQAASNGTFIISRSGRIWGKIIVNRVGRVKVKR